MSHKYLGFLKWFLFILIFAVWVSSGFSGRKVDLGNSPADGSIIPEYSYGLGYIPLKGKVESRPLPSNKYYPSSWDWRSATYNSVTGDWLTVPKNQGGCGSCWDFAATGALEAIINVRSNNPNLDLDLSEQYILSCYSGGWGCNGSNAYYAYEYMYNHGGTIPETCFPYSADDGVPCSDKCANWPDLLVPISDYGYSWSPGQNAIKSMIYEHGPVCLAFDVYTDFYTGSPSFDDNGVYKYDGSSTYRGGHQIVAVGYKDTPGNPDYDGYWICKNSWGATWGPWGDGCFGIAYGQCGIEQELVYVDYEPPSNQPLVRGDYDGDGVIMTNDALMEFQYIYNVSGNIPPSCEDAADYDDDGHILTNDPLMMLQFVFEVPGSYPPPPPYPDCGMDPTQDELGCVSYPPCDKKGNTVAYKPSVSVAGAVDKLMALEVEVTDGLVRVPVELEVTEPVCGLDISLGYDASALRFKEVDGGYGYDFWAVDTRQAGVVRIGAVPDIEMAKLLEPGRHRVGEVVFEVVGKGDMGLRWQRAEVYGADVQPLSMEWVAKAGGSSLPTQFALEQNYPNPFNPSTQIRYALPVDCQVRLEVYNVVGQRVATLVDGHQKAGYKVVSWNAQDMASGIYFYRLKVGEFTAIKEMVLLK